MDKGFYPGKLIFDSNPLDQSLYIELATGQGDSPEIRRRALAEGYREQDKRHIIVVSSSKTKEITKHSNLKADKLNQKIQEIAGKYNWQHK